MSRALASAIDELLRDRPAAIAHRTSGTRSRVPTSQLGASGGGFRGRLPAMLRAARIHAAIWLLLAITFLPGAVIFRLPFADRSKRAALPAEERVFWMVVISIIISTTVAFVLAAMSAYSLERLVVVQRRAAASRAGIASGATCASAPNDAFGWTGLRYCLPR